MFKFNKHFLALIVILLCCVVISSYANIKNNSTALKRVASKIKKVKQSLTQAQSQKAKLQVSLKKTEITIGQYSKNIQDTRKHLSKQKTRLKSAQKKVNKFKKELNAHEKIFSKQIKAAYQLGRMPHLKLLLNQEKPQAINRYLHYYIYINQARLDTIYALKKAYVKVQMATKEVREQARLLEDARYLQQKQKNTVLIEQKQRKKLLVKMRREIKGKEGELKKLYADEKRLTSVVKKLNVQQQYKFAPGKKFPKMRRKLPWPIARGRVIQKYNQAILNGRLHSSGVLIAAKEGATVRAIYPGKVIYADWLKGFGLLVIIQHGKKYMTLYGRDQSLYVKPNQMVKAGQVIATVGNSGGFQRNALYFEIRKNAKPINPLLWLKKR
jgi:murein hydrolase activator